MKIVLEMSERQYLVMVAALEDYSRIIAGQFWILRMPFYNRNEKNGNVEKFERKLKELKQIAFPELGPNSEYGICNKETPENSKITYELYKTLRHERWKLCSPSNYCTVDSSGPLAVSGEVLPRVEIIEDIAMDMDA